MASAPPPHAATQCRARSDRGPRRRFRQTIPPGASSCSGGHRRPRSALRRRSAPSRRAAAAERAAPQGATAKARGRAVPRAGHATHPEDRMYDMIEYPTAPDSEDELNRALQDALNRRA
ncbi:hypothetical protein GCM10009602_60570 [Nocardiopsis tropica]